MKKLILILLSLTISPYNFHAMDNQHINSPQFTHQTITSQTGFAYAMPSFLYDVADQNSSFYDQDYADCRAQIKGGQDIIKQYQSLNDVYSNMQSHKMKSQNEFITQITPVYNKVIQQSPGIKAYDPLIQDQDILKYANIHQPISLQNLPIYHLIVLAQEYIASGHALSMTQKYTLWNKINLLLRTQPLLWHDLSEHNPETLEAFSSFLPMIYDKIWNSYKFMIKSRLLQNLHTAKAQHGNLAAQLSDINEMRATLQRQAAQYNNALLVINSKTAQAVSNENVRPHHEPTQGELIEKNSQSAIVIPVEIEQVIKDTQVAVQSQSSETAKVSEQKNVMHAPKKALPISKKQLAALAAEKKAEQSRIDKERNQLALQEKKVQEAPKKLMPIIPVIATATKSSRSKTSQKKSTHKKSDTISNTDIDAILHAAIAENNKILKTDVPASEKLITQNIDSDIYTPINSPEELTQQPVDLIKYLKFIDTRKAEFSRLEQAKEVQRKANLKKVCLAKAHDRERVKEELEKTLNKKFDPISQIEKDIVCLLNEYAILLSMKNIKNISLEDFIAMKDKIVIAEEELQHHGLHIKWYLNLYPDLYEKIKKAYLKFQQLIEPIIDAQDKFIQNQMHREFRLSDELKEQMHKDLHDQSPLHKQETISRTLRELHKNNGLLDISCLRHLMKTHEELQQLGTLNQDVLDQAEQDIKFLYVLKTAHPDYDLIKPIIFNLLDRARVTPPKNIIDEIITMTAAIASLDKAKNEIEQFLTEVDVKIFYSLQRENELSTTTILTENQMADVTKIHIAAFKALVDIIEV